MWPWTEIKKLKKELQALTVEYRAEQDHADALQAELLKVRADLEKAQKNDARDAKTGKYTKTVKK